MVSRRGLEGPLHPIKGRALQGPLVRQKAVPVVQIVVAVVFPESRHPLLQPWAWILHSLHEIQLEN